MSSSSSSSVYIYDLADELQTMIFNDAMKADDSIYTVGIARLSVGLDGADITLPPGLVLPAGYIPVIKKGYDASLLSGTTVPIVFLNQVHADADEVRAEISKGTSLSNERALLRVSYHFNDVVRDLCKPGETNSATLFMQYAYGPKILDALAPKLMDRVKTVILAGIHDKYKEEAGLQLILWPDRPDYVCSGFPGPDADATFKTFVQKCFGRNPKWQHLQKLICRSYFPFVPFHPTGQSPPDAILADVTLSGESGELYVNEIESWEGVSGTCEQTTVWRCGYSQQAVIDGTRERYHGLHNGHAGCALKESMMRKPGVCVVDPMWPRLVEFPCGEAWNYFL